MSTPRDHRVHAPALAAALGSALLSAAVLLRRPLVNNDGVYYLLAAEAFARDGLDAARAVYPWPFFSVLVAGVAAVLRLSTEAAAQVTCAALLAAASAAFVLVVRRLGGTPRMEWLAAAVVLAHPWLNQARDQVVRDVGVWALALLALRALLDMEEGRPGPVARWAAFGSAAVLFRPDAAALLLAAPLALLPRRDAAGRRRIPAALVALAVALAASAAALAWLFTTVEVSTANFRRAATALAASFPLPYGREYAPVLLAAGLAVLPVVKTLKTLGVTHALLAAAGAWRARPASGFHRGALLATLAAAALPLYVQAARLLFVESRYTIVATLVLGLLAPFGAAWLLDRGPRWTGAALAAALVATAVLGLPRGDASAPHVRAAAAWVRDHGGGAPLRTNSLQVAYLSRAPVDWPRVRLAAVGDPLDGAASRPGDLWVVRIPRADGVLRARLDALASFTPRASFEGPDGDAVRIYACTASAGCTVGPGR
jgi:hypothetical protein